MHLCWGEADRATPPAIAQHLKEIICPRAKLTIIPGAGHFIEQEKPEELLRELLTFWDKVEYQGPSSIDRLKNNADDN